MICGTGVAGYFDTPCPQWEFWGADVGWALFLLLCSIYVLSCVYKLSGVLVWLVEFRSVGRLAGQMQPSAAAYVPELYVIRGHGAAGEEAVR